MVGSREPSDAPRTTGQAFQSQAVPSVECRGQRHARAASEAARVSQPARADEGHEATTYISSAFGFARLQTILQLAFPAQQAEITIFFPLMSSKLCTMCDEKQPVQDMAGQVRLKRCRTAPDRVGFLYVSGCERGVQSRGHRPEWVN